MRQIVVGFSISGQFSEWPYFQTYCEKSMTDSNGLSVGIISKFITTDFGIFPVKYVLLFFGENINHNLKTKNRYTEDEVTKIGLDNLLNELGRKTVVNIHFKDRSPDLKI